MPRPSSSPKLEPAKYDLVLLHARLHCEDAEWSLALVQSLARFPVWLQERVRRQHRLADRCAQILDKWLLLKALDCMGVSDATLDNLKYDAFGRPSMQTGPGYDFSLSHSGNFVACVVGRQGRVGVDVELLREIRSSDFAEVFAESAWKRLEQQGDSREAFFREWTQLEAVLKADGRGMSVVPGAVECDGRRAYLSGELHQCWFLHEVVLDSDYSCHIAGIEENPRILSRTCVWNETELRLEP
jgi:4'-phosphopantetheinyl transferase